MEALANAGSALHELGRFAEAAGRHRRVVALAPNLPAAQFHLGNALRELGRAGEAIAEYSQALAIDAGHAGARFHLAGLLLAKSRAKEAFEQYERILRDEPRAPHLLEAMQRAAAASSDPAEAAELRARLGAARKAPR